MKKFLLLVLISVCWMSVWADEFEFSYDDESNTATVIGYDSEHADILVIPETVSYSGKTYTVRSIESLNSIYLEIYANSLIIPETVTSVSPNAFVSLNHWGWGLKTITMPEILDVSEASLYIHSAQTCPNKGCASSITFWNISVIRSFSKSDIFAGNAFV